MASVPLQRPGPAILSLQGPVVQWGVGHADDGGVSRRLAPIRPYWTDESTLTDRSQQAGQTHRPDGSVPLQRPGRRSYHYRVQLKKANGEWGMLTTTPWSLKARPPNPTVLDWREHSDQSITKSRIESIDGVAQTIQGQAAHLSLQGPVEEDQWAGRGIADDGGVS